MNKTDYCYYWVHYTHLLFCYSRLSNTSLFLFLFLVEDILKKGHVPPPPQYYVRRTELIRSIRKELRKLKNTDSWVLLSGLPGYGNYAIQCFF